MNERPEDESRDSDIQALFAAAEVELQDEAFVAAVARQVAQNRRSVGALRWLLPGGIILIGLIAAGLQAWVGDAVLLDMAPSVLSQILAPFNSVGGLLGLVFAAFWFAYRKLLA